MNAFSYIWLGCMILFGILEAATVSLVSLWFVGGALAAFLAAILGAPLWLQVTVFVAVSAVLLACLRPFVKKVAQPKKEPTNSDRIIGQQVPVIEAVDNLAGTGAVKADGKQWSAKSEDGSLIEAGAVVTVVKIEGVKVIVRR